MRHLKYILFLVILFGMVGQPSAEIHLYIGGGTGTPVFPYQLKDYWETGYDICGGVGLPAFRHSEIIGVLSYTKLYMEKGINSTGYAFEGGAVKILAFSIKYKIARRMDKYRVIRPYLIAGTGITALRRDYYYRILAEDSAKFAASRNTSISLSFGGGVEFRIFSWHKIWLDLTYALAKNADDFYDGHMLHLGDDVSHQLHMRIRVGFKFVLGRGNPLIK